MIDLLITGVHGQLGRALEGLARRRGLSVEGHDLDTLDIRDNGAVAQLIGRLRPRVLVNCAAFTAVDACETDEATATAINGTAVGHLAAACNVAGALLVHLSTDYVFAGDGTRPYTETDPVAPASAYGRSKLAGERLARSADRHLIVRTAWLYGRGGANFVEAIRRQIDGGAASLRVVADQVGSPTFCDDLAGALLELIDAEARGVVHAANSGSTSWHGFAVEIVRRLGAEVEVHAVTTADFPRPARRPAYSVLDTSLMAAAIGHHLPPWQDALARYLEGPCAP
ncbi:MAG TPA: dTDP-4-dehydrorhamnose reductase [Thermoanaerobaculales bacterium]|nr:dTDP-4-dehydrorhamnose reductase [Thermoanaerobaculales bacterium]HQL29736.1 dTDP-4-dehydrorhamnose reductase [Thermoanaerobaculales bacterium]